MNRFAKVPLLALVATLGPAACAAADPVEDVLNAHVPGPCAPCPDAGASACGTWHVHEERVPPEIHWHPCPGPEP